MKYLKLFEKQSDYQSYYYSDEFVTPNVSLVKEENIVFFNPFSAPKNVITYTANKKLTETTNTSLSGLHTASFNTTIVSHEFDNGVGTIVFEEDVTYIGYHAFLNCSGLTSIVIPDSVTSIGESAFRGCSGLTSIVIPNSVTYIREHAFYNCKGLTSVTIPDSVTSIDRVAFADCLNLTSITIGSGVTSIKSQVFSGCSGLSSITCYAPTAPSVSSDTFYGIKSNGTLYYPSGSDYSSWLTTSSDYLGYYGWIGQEITD